MVVLVYAVIQAQLSIAFPPTLRSMKDKFNGCPSCSDKEAVSTIW